MITVFKNQSYNSVVDRITNLFDDYHINYEVLTPKRLKRGYIRHILEISDNGFEQIMISKMRGKKLYSQVFGRNNIESFAVNEMIDILLMNPKLLKSPIIFNDKQLLTGYDPEALRSFLPKSRQLHL